MAAYLFEVEQKNSLEQKGLLKRFSLDCYGKQPTMEEIRATKAQKYEELKGKTGPKDVKEKEMWFLKYRPVEAKPWLKRGRVRTAASHKTPAKTVEIGPGPRETLPKRTFFKKTRNFRRNSGPKNPYAEGRVKNPYAEGRVKNPYVRRRFTFSRRR
jgi:hypothetical protein